MRDITMNAAPVCPQATTPRDLLFFQTPELWPQHPFLAVVRRRQGEEDPELGLLYDARSVSGAVGHSATVFLSNYFEAPVVEAEFLALPKIVYANAEELAAAGWTVD